jgi:arsenite/tail-anchored protein-transporting ATPase
MKYYNAIGFSKDYKKGGLKMTRIIIFTGKGGVGKTSVAAAHARKAALMGKETLIVSADMAHNLSDLFEMPIGKEVTEIAPKLYALEIDPEFLMEHEYSSMMKAFEKMLPNAEGGKGGANLGDLSMFPGMEELFSLLKIQDLYETGRYDVIIVDCAPTGETLSLLKFPELFSWYMEKFFPIGKVAMKVLRPVSKKFFQIEIPNGKAMNDIEKLYVKLFSLQKLFKNKEVTSLRLVAVPEKMAVEETKRNYMYLNLYNYNVDGLFINRILPKEVDSSFFHEWIDIQAGYIEELKDVFGNIPIGSIKWYDIDLNGMEAIDRLVSDVLTEDNLFEVKIMKPNESYEKAGEGYLLHVNLPCVKKEEIMMHESGKDIILRIGNFKRSIPIPETLRNHLVSSAKFEDNILTIQFKLKEGE